MFALKRIPTALAGVGVGLVGVSGAHAVDTPGRVGAFRTELGDLTKGLTVSLAEGLRYDSNIVRTANDAETLAAYGTTNSSDLVSQTSINITFKHAGRRTKISFGGDLSYAKYSNFDQFSGFVSGGTGSADWQFTNRCSMGVSGRIERRVADFADVTLPQGDFQLEYNGNYNASCFILSRVRISGEVFGDQVRNDVNSFKFADVDYWGWQAALAYVTPKGNEVGARFRLSKTSRPNDPTVEDVENDRIEAYTSFKVGNYVNVTLSGGDEIEKRRSISDQHRASAAINVLWTPTQRIESRFGYIRDTEDATDLIQTTSQTDRFFTDTTWHVTANVSAGVRASYENDELNSGPVGALTGVSEQVGSVGAYVQHPFFHTVNVRWYAGYDRRDSDFALRKYESFSAGISVGIGF